MTGIGCHGNPPSRLVGLRSFIVESSSPTTARPLRVPTKSNCNLDGWRRANGRRIVRSATCLGPLGATSRWRTGTRQRHSSGSLADWGVFGPRTPLSWSVNLIWPLFLHYDSSGTRWFEWYQCPSMFWLAISASRTMTEWSPREEALLPGLPASRRPVAAASNRYCRPVVSPTLAQSEAGY